MGGCSWGGILWKKTQSRVTLILFGAEDMVTKYHSEFSKGSDSLLLESIARLYFTKISRIKRSPNLIPVPCQCPNILFTPSYNFCRTNQPTKAYLTIFPPLPIQPWYNRIKPAEYPSSYLMNPRRLPLLFPASRCSIPSAAVSSHGSQLV